MTLNENLQKAQYSTHIIIPFRSLSFNGLSNLEKQYKHSLFSRSNSKSTLIETDGSQKINMDLNDNIYKLFDNGYDGRIASVHTIYQADIYMQWFGEERCILCVDDEKKTFEITQAILYTFNTGVAFLVVHFKYSNIDVMRSIFDPSTLKISSQINITCHKSSGRTEKRSLRCCIQELIKGTHLDSFFSFKSDTFFSDSYAASVAVIPERIKDIHTFKRISFNLQRMQALGKRIYDDEAINSALYTYPNQNNRSYQWCTCVGDCSISRVRCHDDFDRQIEDFRANSLTLLLLALYQKYSSLLFSERLRMDIKDGKKKFRKLKKEMIAFKAFGKIAEGGTSRFANVRLHYQQMMCINGISESLTEIDEKLTVIAARENEKKNSIIGFITFILSILGIVSIVADLITIWPF